MQRKLTIRVYKIKKSPWDVCEMYDEQTRIELPEIIPLGNIQQAMMLLGFTDGIYKVQEGDGWSNDKVIYAHPKLVEIDRLDAESRQKHLAQMQVKADEFNKLPTIVQEWKFGEGYSIQMTRGEAKFNPSFSTSRIGGEVYLTLLKDGKEEWDNRNRSSFSLYRYISQDGKVLAKAFKEGMKYDVTSETVRAEMVGKLKEINDAEKSFSQKWQLGR